MLNTNAAPSLNPSPEGAGLQNTGKALSQRKQTSRLTPLSFGRGVGGEGRGRGFERLALLAIMLLAIGLRLGAPGIVEFKRDEANLSHLALDLVHGRSFPLLGINSSVGIRNAPINVYVMAIPYLISDDPTLATAFVALLNVIAVLLVYLLARRYYGSVAALSAALLYAASPWAVIFSRKIWAQDLLPMFILLTIGTGLLGFLEGKRWAQAIHLPLLAITGQLHYGAFILIPITLYLIIVGRKRLTRAFAFSVIGMILVTLPFVIGAVQTGMFSAATLKKIASSGGDKPHSLSLSGEAIQDTALTLAGTELQALAGPQQADAFLARIPKVYPLFDMLVIATVIAALWLVVASTIALTPNPSPEGEGSQIPELGQTHDVASPSLLVGEGFRKGAVNVTLLIWLLFTPLVYSLTWTTFYTHYLIPMLPAPFLVIGAALSDAWRALADRRRARTVVFAVCGIALVGLVTLQSGVLLTLFNFVDTHNTPGGFGTPLHDQMPARQAILDQHPQNVLVNLDGQYIGYHDETTIWNTLLYPVPSIRFLDGNTEVYPAEPAVYLSHACNGTAPPVQTFQLRPPNEGCYAVQPRLPGDLNVAAYTPIPKTDAVRFANGAQVIGTRWTLDPRACLAVLWTVAAPVPDDYSFSVHFTDANGKEIIFADGLSWRGQYWRSGDRIVRTFCPDSGQDRKSEIAGVHIGMYTYDGVTFHNVDLLNASGGAVGQTLDIPLTAAVASSP